MTVPVRTGVYGREVDVLTSGDVTGDVVGPAGATDGAIVLFDGTTGKLIKDSGVVLQTAGGGTNVLADDGTYVPLAGAGASGASIDDKGLTPLLTAGDQAVTGLTITNTPSPNGAGTGLGYVTVVVNGVVVRLGGATTGAPCYFSSDGGATALPADEIIAGAQLIWNQTVGAGGLGYNLDPNDSVDFLYEAT